MKNFNVHSWSSIHEPVVMWLIRMKVPDTKGAICQGAAIHLHQLEKGNWRYFKVFRFYFLGEHKTVIYERLYSTCVHRSLIYRNRSTRSTSAVSGSVQSVPAIAVHASLQEAHKRNWTGVYCMCVWGGDLLFGVFSCASWFDITIFCGSYVQYIVVQYTFILKFRDKCKLLVSYK